MTIIEHNYNKLQEMNAEIDLCYKLINEIKQVDITWRNYDGVLTIRPFYIIECYKEIVKILEERIKVLNEQINQFIKV